jgi:hypothetical protein
MFFKTGVENWVWGEQAVCKGMCDEEICVTVVTRCCSAGKWDNEKRQRICCHSPNSMHGKMGKQEMCHWGSEMWCGLRAHFAGSPEVSEACIVVLPPLDFPTVTLVWLGIVLTAKMASAEGIGHESPCYPCVLTLHTQRPSSMGTWQPETVLKRMSILHQKQAENQGTETLQKTYIGSVHRKTQMCNAWRSYGEGLKTPAQ